MITRRHGASLSASAPKPAGIEAVIAVRRSIPRGDVFLEDFKTSLGSSLRELIRISPT
jgi:hypothetical protein